MDFVFSCADILIPKVELEPWATIACDQYTSEPEYWEKVKDFVGERYSAYRLVLPEVYLKEDNSEMAEKINAEMQSLLDKGIFEKYENSLMYIERTQSDGKIRRGILGKIDLEQYDYRPKTDAAVRATEKTVLSRIPPRVEIRKNAALELPHVMLLIDDPQKTVIEPLDNEQISLTKLYDFELMFGAGHIRGSLIDKAGSERIISALKELYNKNDGFLFSVGDGNHSLAVAKEVYNSNKNEKSRYALVEVVNIHDPALEFEPIYRVVFGVEPEKFINKFTDYCGGEYTGEDAQQFECYFGDKKKTISVNSDFKLAVATLQTFLDEQIEKDPSIKIDYIHGVSSLKNLSKKDGALGFIFKGMSKDELFTSVSADGSLPRKTFSMGHADDKRFYIEAREIK